MGRNVSDQFRLQNGTVIPLDSFVFIVVKAGEVH